MKIDQSDLHLADENGQLDGESGQSRRSFLKSMGFSLSALPLASCMPIPVKKAIPYLIKNENIVPGVANWYATTCHGCDQTCALLVKCREGRPIKIEGNEKSPVTLGGVCPIGQGTVLSLYDSYRYKSPTISGKNVVWEEFDRQVMEQLEFMAKQKQRVVLFTGPVKSPSKQKLIKELTKRYSNIHHQVYDANSNSAIVEAHQQTFGVRGVPTYRLDKANYLLSIGADFLGGWENPVAWNKQYSARRDLEKSSSLLRHVQVESNMSLSGSNADWRVTVAPADEVTLLLHILKRLLSRSGKSDYALNKLPAFDEESVNQIIKELWNNRGRALVIAGSNSLQVQLAVALINQLLGNYDKTLEIDRGNHRNWLANDKKVETTIDKMVAGKIGGVIFWDVNPLYNYYDGQRIQQAIKNVPFSLSFASAPDESSTSSKYVAPANHFLESWGDSFINHTTIGLTQPVIQPLYGSRMAEESILTWIGSKQKSYYDYLKNNWGKSFFKLQRKEVAAERFWQQSLHDGLAILDQVSIKRTKFKFPALSPVIRGVIDQYNLINGGQTLTVYQKPAMGDGRHANNPWLQEVPDPVTKATWDNYLMIAPADAKQQVLKDGDVVEVRGKRGAVKVPVLVQPGQSAGSFALAVGYGRRVSGKVGSEVGVNAYPFVSLQNGNYLYREAGITISKTGNHRKIAQTQTHHSMEGRDLVRQSSLDKYIENPAAGNENKIKLISMWSEHDTSKGHAWGMAVDLNKCTGCSACVVSCNAENNIPVVGRQEVINRRDMHWMRIDRYYLGDDTSPEVVHQPLNCQHCDNAPCETVCPVLATVQSSDGLNQQVYNRCVGTRYCANNCPYKVRRFNWFDYPHNDKNENMVLNPDVTIRSRGVMEKCSMCIQRIQEGKLNAKKEGRELQDGEIKLACQQSCPGDAIIFGDLNDPDSRISASLKNPRNYVLLEELNVKPRVSYLTKIRNKG
ncbi:MAG: 4Fe-4S dicluster domain-containing protein [Bdellovibrionales bacterium]|jgi:Fe-S-cluster-containing dehydrogenase component/anaerobic selenocysteine-containing dehydrogenase|nr:4Fe-4S dicluster domain-containing protein [Bdellovibrionales bacterium]MBT3527055.1 4Fe-4S dicluster domain-containing protein [Bdellovibrionales bacterium]MBT7765592.1 4Fe-4S dicluster domain-containing protein [Bdellovibrionales bacterium]